MYFITTNRPGYILFCMTPSERGAIGLTAEQVVQLLVRSSRDDQWSVQHEWNAKDYSHTDLLAALHHVAEPDDPRQLLDFLPARLRQG